MIINMTSNKIFSSQTIRNTLVSLCALLLSFVIGGIIIAAIGHNPFNAYYLMFIGAFGSVREIANTIANSIPLIFTGLAVAVGSKSGLLNIGAEGQLYIGSMCGTLCALYLPVENKFVMIVCVIAASIIGGMAWGSIPGILKAYFRTNEVIVCIMLNYMATLFTTWLVISPLREQGSSINQTATIPLSAQLSKLIPRTQLTTALFIALTTVVLVWYVFEYTAFGFKMRIVGGNIGAAKANGIIPSKYIVYAMAFSGGIASLAGTTEIIGKYYRFRENFSMNLGFTGIAVAVLAKNNPFVAIITAILFSALNTGALNMSRLTGISGNMATVIQSIIILLVAAPRIIEMFFKRKGRS